jgi:hypothetical protein
MNAPVFIRYTLLGLLSTAAGAAAAHDYPTADRVLYVQECMRAHPGPNYEMVNKCSCALDALARDVSYEDFVSMNTATNANSIGGERGGTIRDTAVLQVQVKRYRELQARAKGGCFINTGAR